MIKLSSGLIISGNSKAGLSMNFSLSTCWPTELCVKICYARFRNACDARRLGDGSTPNTGPITWETQQLAYKRNTRILEDAYKKDIDGIFDEGKDATHVWAIADELADVLHQRGGSNIRWNGQGDLTKASVRLIYCLALNQVKVWGFTRKAAELDILTALLHHATGPAVQPFFQVSIDSSTREDDVRELLAAADRLNGPGVKSVAIAAVAGVPRRSLQLSLEAMNARRWIEGLPFKDKVRTVFGYHTSFGHTIIGVPEECPATRGDNIICWQCRRCWGEEQSG